MFLHQRFSLDVARTFLFTKALLSIANADAKPAERKLYYVTSLVVRSGKKFENHEILANKLVKNMFRGGWAGNLGLPCLWENAKYKIHFVCFLISMP